jgi:hypothetical protein
MVHVGFSHKPFLRHSIDTLFASYPLSQLIFATDPNVVDEIVTLPLGTVTLEPHPMGNIVE